MRARVYTRLRMCDRAFELDPLARGARREQCHDVRTGKDRAAKARKTWDVCVYAHACVRARSLAH